MADVVDARTRSRMMAGIQGKNTKPELKLRAALHALGLRYRLHQKDLPGKPDLVFPKFRAAVFVHGCFWHRHEGCRFATTPATRTDFWRSKFEQNMRRDQKVLTVLERTGWRVAIVWECAIKQMDIDDLSAKVANWLMSDIPTLRVPRIEQNAD